MVHHSTPPPHTHTHNQNNYDWSHFTPNNGLNAINNKNSFTRQGGHNYTSTNLKDGFYSNHPNHNNNLQCYTITNLNQNYDWFYRIPLLEKVPQHHGHKGDPEVTSRACAAIGEKDQVILVWVKAPCVENPSHAWKLGVTRVKP